MNDNSDLLPNLSHDDAFEVQLRGYSRRQVDDFVGRCQRQIRDLEQRLSRALDESEELRRNLAAARQQALGAKPAHEEVSERIAQILKLADDEARSQKSKAQEDITQLRAEAQAETERVRAESRDQAERMLTAAQEQAERAITSARADAEKARTAARTEADRLTTTARTEAERVTTTARAEAERAVTTARADAERTVTEAQKKAENALSSAKAQAKKALDEATARASAIHDGAERRLNLLSTRHAETVKQLTEILEGVSVLVAAEAARPSLEDEVALAAATAMPGAGIDPANTTPGYNPASGQSAQSAVKAPLPPKASPTGAQPQTGPGGQKPGVPHGAPATPMTPAGRAQTIDTDEETEGVRIMPAPAGQ